MFKKPLLMCFLLLFVEKTLQHCEENRQTAMIDKSNGNCEQGEDYDSDPEMNFIEYWKCKRLNTDHQTVLNVITCFNETPERIKTATVLQNNTYPIELVLKNISIPELSTALSVIDEWNVTKIEMVQLNISKIAPKYFHNIENLTELWLDNNNLTAVSDDVFSSISTLKYLSLSHNKIKYLSDNSFKHNRNLEMLDLTNNQISTLPEHIFEDLHSLLELELSNNKLIGDIDLRLLPTAKLHHLDLSMNQITTLRGLNITSYSTTLLISHNNLTVLQNMGQVYKLNASYNRIQKLDDDVFHPLLVEVDLSHNLISELSDKVFSNLKQLVSLHLDHNLLSKLPVSCFRDLTSLEILDLSYNNLIQSPYGLFANLISLTHLDISNNNLEFEIESLFGLKTLINLKFAHNRVKHIDVQALIDHFPVLQTVSLENNFWTCKELSKIFTVLNNRWHAIPAVPSYLYRRHNLKRLQIMEGSTYDQENVNGIACSSDDDYQKTENSNFKAENLINYFENFNNTNLYKHIEGLKLNKTESFKNFLQHELKNTDFYEVLHKIVTSVVKECCNGEEKNSNIFNIFICIILVFILSFLVIQMFIIRKSLFRLAREHVELSTVNLLSEN